MYNYIIRTYDPESSMQIELLHEKAFTEEEFDEMAAECFAVAIKNQCDAEGYDFIKDSITGVFSIDDFVTPVAKIMSKKYGFIIPEEKEITQIFDSYWYISRRDDAQNSKLIFKHIDKLLKP